MNGPAPVGGAVVTLASTVTAAATVPASVTVPAGATTAAFTISTLTVASNTTSLTKGTFGGVTPQATLTVASARQSYSVGLNPTSVMHGATSTATVTLNGVAPTGGALVTLTSSSTANATVPANVTVAAGTRSATFTVTTLAGGTAASVNISGAYGGATKTGTLALTSTAAPYAVSFSPSPVLGGNASTGTVTLNGAAPVGGLVVSLFSTDTVHATVPASVTVAAATTTATFAVATFGVSAPTDVSVYATVGAVSVKGTISLTSAALSGLTLSPASVTAGTSSTGTVTLSTPAAPGDAVVGLVSSNTAAATVPATVTVASGATSATFAVTTLGVASTATVSITASRLGVNFSPTLTVNPAAIFSVAVSPTTVVSGTSSTGTVTLTGKAPPGGAVVTLSSNNTAVATVPASVTVAAQALTATFTVTTLGVASAATPTITATYLTVPRTATLTVNPAPISAVSVSPATVVGGNNSTGTVTLIGKAPPAGAVVTLSSSVTTAATVPANVTVAAGSSTANFTVTTLPVSSPTTVTISAISAGVTKTATLTVTASLSAASLSPASVVGGNPSTATVTLTTQAPTGGVTVTLSSSNTPAASVPASMSIAAGATSGTFSVTTSAVASPTTVTISASYAATTKTATLTVTKATVPTGELTEGNAASWGSFAPIDNAATSVSDDTTHVKAGSKSIKFVTASGFDTGVVFPATADAHWDLTNVAYLRFWIFAINTNGGGFQGNEPIVVLKTSGGDLTYTSASTFIPANGWQFYQFALQGDSYWAQSATGTPNLADVLQLEIHDDTWGAGFTLFFDGLEFGSSLPDELTEGNAASWGSFAPVDSATTSVSDDTTHVKVGAKSLKFVTASGFDTGVLYPATPIAHWDLSTVDHLSFWIYAVNGNAGGFQGNQPVVILNTAGGSLRYEAQGTLMPIGSWMFYEIPLAGGGAWSLTATGSPTLSDVNQVEIHHDTWGSGFTLYYDRLGFGLTASLAAMTLSPTSVAGGVSATGTVSLTTAAPAGGAVVSLSTSVTFTANWSGVNKTATLTVTPLTVTLSSVSLNPTSVVSGAASTGTATVSDLAPPGGVVVSLSSSNTAAATVPATVTIPAGAASATFTVNSLGVASNSSVTVSASYAGTTRTANLTVTPASLSSVGVSPGVVVGGNASTGTVSLNGLAPPGAVVSLWSGNTSVANVPASVTVSSGSAAASFTVTTSSVTSISTTTINATYSGVSKTAWITVTPPGPCTLGTVAAPSSFPASDIVWFDDSLPAGVTTSGTWVWDTTQKASGTQSHTDPAGPGQHEHVFYDANPGFYVASTDKLVAYAMINPCDPAQEIMIQWGAAGNGWEHRAYWGADLIGYGTPATPGRVFMGPLPAAGGWVRLEVPASSLDLAGRTVNAMSFVADSGQVWWDRIGKAATCTPVLASTPAPDTAETIWVDDQVPAGTNSYGVWNWDTTQKASGTQLHTEPGTTGLHYHGFDSAWGNNFYVEQTDKLIAWVLIDPCDPPQEILIDWQGNTAGERFVFWGLDLIAWGTLGVDRVNMGPLPPTGQWVRLDVPASTLGLGGSLIGQIRFTLYDGHVWWDRIGKLAICLPGVAAAPSSLPPDTVWLDDAVPPGATTGGTWVWDTTQKASGTASHTDPVTAGQREHVFYEVASARRGVG